MGCCIWIRRCSDPKPLPGCVELTYDGSEDGGHEDGNDILDCELCGLDWATDFGTTD